MSKNRERTPQEEQSSEQLRRTGGREGAGQEAREAYRPEGYGQPPSVEVKQADVQSGETTGVARYPKNVHEVGRHSGEEGARYRRPDMEIGRDIERRVVGDATVDASRVHVEVEDGRVRLHGQVDSEDSRRKLREMIERIPGVEAVADGDLHANPAAGAHTGDTGR